MRRASGRQQRQDEPMHRGRNRRNAEYGTGAPILTASADRPRRRGAGWRQARKGAKARGPRRGALQEAPRMPTARGAADRTSAAPAGRRSEPHVGCSTYRLNLSYRFDSANAQRCRLRGGGEAIGRGEKGDVFLGSFRRVPSASACRPSPSRRGTALWPS